MNIFYTLAFLTIYAISLAKLTKKGLEPGFILGVPQLFAYLFFAYQVTHFAPFSVTAGNIALGFVLSVWATAFTIGVSFLTTNLLSVEEGSLILNEHPITSKIAKYVDGKSLCQLSWLAALAIFLLPVAALCIVAISFVTSICVWFGTGVNFFHYFTAMCKLEKLPYTKSLTFKNGLPKAPLPYVFTISGVSLIVYGIYKAFTQPAILNGLGQALLILVVLLVSILVALTVFDFVLNKSVSALYNRKDNFSEDIALDIEYVYSRKQRKQSLSIKDYVDAFGQVFLYKYCPKIVAKTTKEKDEDCYDTDGD